MKMHLGSPLPSWVSLILFCIPFASSAQNKVIDFRAIEQWQTMDKRTCAISNNGASFMWRSKIGSTYTMHLQGTAEKWEYSFPGATWLGFARNSETAVFTIPGDSLVFFRLNSFEKTYLGKIRRCLFLDGSDSDYVFYSLKDEIGTLYFRNLLSGSEYRLQNITEWIVGKNNSLLISSKVAEDSVQLQFLDPATRELKTIWKGLHPGQYVSNSAGDRFAFMAANTIWYLKSGMGKAIPLVSESQLRQVDGYVIDGQLQFSADDKWLFFNAQKDTSVVEPSSKGVKADVWNYKDVQLQPRQLFLSATTHNKGYCGVVSLDSVEQGGNPSFSILEQRGDDLMLVPQYLSGDFVSVVHRNGGYHEDWWNPASMPEVLLVSLKDGGRKLIKKARPTFADMLSFFVSPGGKYLVYFDNLGGKRPSLQWYSMEIKTGKTRCLTDGIGVPFNIQADEDDMPMMHFDPYGYGVLGWAGKDEYVLIRDQYDIWRFDLTFRSAPLNLTKAYGRANKIQFNVFSDNNVPLKRWKVSDTVILSAYSRKTKETGFFILQLDKVNLRRLAFGPYQYNTVMKAKEASTWIVGRESASDAPNWFLTHDWKKFDKITNVQPQQLYNWLTVELVHWRTFKGNAAEGLLYKPENFDSNRKYPVIVHYYQQMSQQLYWYLRPYYTKDDLNIPYMVSRGYLVFVPDIHYTIGETGESAYDFIVSGAEYLRKKQFVDGSRMGLQGHSFGGYETQYVITRSRLFAAAVSAAGWPDFVSRNGAILVGGESGQFAAETQRSRIGATLWERPGLYIKNSPIFRANNIITPLLMMNNPMDDQVPFSQGIELFTSLRRLQKPVWMLSYDEERHTLMKKENYVDWTIRMTQFFDHYLKGSLPPNWMTRGVPAARKGIDTGYELDAIGACWVKCPVCQKKNYLKESKLSKRSSAPNSTREN